MRPFDATFRLRSPPGIPVRTRRSVATENQVLAGAASLYRLRM